VGGRPTQAEDAARRDGTLRTHRLEWKRQQQAPSLTLFGVLVSQKVGPFTLRREYHVSR